MYLAFESSILRIDAYKLNIKSNELDALSHEKGTVLNVTQMFDESTIFVCNLNNLLTQNFSGKSKQGIGYSELSLETFEIELIMPSSSNKKESI